MRMYQRNGKPTGEFPWKPKRPRSAQWRSPGRGVLDVIVDGGESAKSLNRRIAPTGRKLHNLGKAVNQLRGASAPRRLCGSAGFGTGSAGGGGASGSLMQKNRHRDARPIYC